MFKVCVPTSVLVADLEKDFHLEPVASNLVILFLLGKEKQKLLAQQQTKRKQHTLFFVQWLPRYPWHSSVSFITILAASCQDCQVTTGSDCFSDSYVSCQAGFTDGPSHIEGPGAAPNCSDSGGDGRRTGLRHSPNTDWLTSQHRWGIRKWPDSLLRVVFSLRVKADGHDFTQPQRKYGREKVLPNPRKSCFLTVGALCEEQGSNNGRQLQRLSVLWCKNLHQSLLSHVGTSLSANHLSHKPEDYSQEGAVPDSPGGLLCFYESC